MKLVELDATRATVLLALFVGLGLALHSLFFIFALLVALALLWQHFYPIARH